MAHPAGIVDAVGKAERATQSRVLRSSAMSLATATSARSDGEGNSNVEEGILTAWLAKRGHAAAQIAAELYRLRTEADNPNRTLYKAKAIEYEEYLKRIAELVKNIEAGKSAGTPEELDTPGKRAIYNNLRGDTDSLVTDGVGGASSIADSSVDAALALALRIDGAVKEARPDGWRGVQSREQAVKAALYRELQDVEAVERLFRVIQAQSEY